MSPPPYSAFSQVRRSGNGKYELVSVSECVKVKDDFPGLVIARDVKIPEAVAVQCCGCLEGAEVLGGLTCHHRPDYDHSDHA